MRSLSALRPCWALFTLLALGSAACSFAAVAEVTDVTDLAGRQGDAVWQVDAHGCGWRSRGSAFAIDGRHLVTNRHVIAVDSSPIIRSRNGEERTGKVIGSSTHPDVAVIEVEQDLPAHLRWATTSALGTQEPIVVLGYPSPDYVFKASTGRIVRFQHGNGAREAALVNAPVAGGNSGGPGLRGDATVAGLVTEMIIRDKPEQRVAILFTADALRAPVTRFLREPSKVLSTCGLGPDYVPPVPKSYDIKQAPPAAEPLETVPVPPDAPATAPVVAPAPRATGQDPTAAPVEPLACPEGKPAVEVNEVMAAEKTDDPGWWRVEVRGLVDNRSYGRIVVRGIEVTVDGEPPVTGPAGGYAGTLEPFQKTGWVFEERVVYSPSGQPTRAEATLDWYWMNSQDWPRASECPSDDATSSGPDPTSTP